MAYTCQLCKSEFDKLNGLSKHLTIKHEGVCKEKYTLDYFYGSKISKCGCGCKADTTYKSFGTFRKFISGHNSRVDNPFKGGLNKTKNE